MTQRDPAVPDECRRWNERYAAEPSYFGDRPSLCLQRALAAGGLPARAAPRALCLGEGEGRDAIHLARRGWAVVAVDGAAVGLSKLDARARSEGLPIATVCADLTDYAPEGSFDLACCFYCHLAPPVRRALFARAAAALAPGGTFLVEGFAREQRLRGRTSGGPPDVGLLYDAEELRAELAAVLHHVTVEERTVEIDHGRHRGTAEIVLGTARTARQ